MLNYNNISWKTPAFFNACTVRSIQTHKKYECFDQTWYQENYRKIFFEYVVLTAKEGHSKAKIVLDECLQDKQFLIESIQFFDDLLEGWYNITLSDNPPVKRSTPLITSDCFS